MGFHEARHREGVFKSDRRPGVARPNECRPRDWLPSDWRPRDWRRDSLPIDGRVADMMFLCWDGPACFSLASNASR